MHLLIIDSLRTKQWIHLVVYSHSSSAWLLWSQDPMDRSVGMLRNAEEIRQQEIPEQEAEIRLITLKV